MRKFASLKRPPPFPARHPPPLTNGREYHFPSDPVFRRNEKELIARAAELEMETFWMEIRLRRRAMRCLRSGWSAVVRVSGGGLPVCFRVQCLVGVYPSISTTRLVPAASPRERDKGLRPRAQFQFLWLIEKLILPELWCDEGGGGEVSFPRWRKDKEPLSPHIITFELIVFEIFLIAMFRNLHPVFLCEIKQFILYCYCMM